MNKVFFWLCAGATLLSAVVSAFFSILPLVGSPLANNVVLLYVASRSLAILAVVIFVLVRRSVLGLVTMAFTMTLVQIFDMVPGFFAKDFAGPAILAAINLITVFLLLRRSNFH